MYPASLDHSPEIVDGRLSESISGIKRGRLLLVGGKQKYQEACVVLRAVVSIVKLALSNILTFLTTLML